MMHPYADSQMHRCHLIEIAVLLPFPDPMRVAYEIERYVLRDATTRSQTWRLWAVRQCVPRGSTYVLFEDLLSEAEDFYQWAAVRQPKGGYRTITDPEITEEAGP